MMGMTLMTMVTMMTTMNHDSDYAVKCSQRDDDDYDHVCFHAPAPSPTTQHDDYDDETMTMITCLCAFFLGALTGLPPAPLLHDDDDH